MRDESIFRVSDEAMSENIGDFLDRTLYKENTTDFERVYDKERQVKGIDTIFTLFDERYHCDEKASVRWRNLNTFSLEISFINRRGDVVDGWFVSDKCENDSYLFIWIDDHGDGEKVEAALVRKKSLMDYIESIGWTKEKMKEKSQQIREQDGIGINFGNLKKNGCKFSFSRKLVEKPINILLPRETLINLADFVFRRDLS